MVLILRILLTHYLRSKNYVPFIFVGFFSFILKELGFIKILFPLILISSYFSVFYKTSRINMALIRLTGFRPAKLIIQSNIIYVLFFNIALLPEYIYRVIYIGELYLFMINLNSIFVFCLFWGNILSNSDLQSINGSLIRNLSIYTMFIIGISAFASVFSFLDSNISFAIMVIVWLYDAMRYKTIRQDLILLNYDKN